MECLLLEIQKLLGKKWTILILQELFHTKCLSFNEINTKLKTVTNKIIASRLKNLEKNHLITRTIIKEKPLRVEYTLTEKGRELMEIFDAMKRWGIKHKFVPERCIETNCNNCTRKQI